MEGMIHDLPMPSTYTVPTISATVAAWNPTRARMNIWLLLKFPCLKDTNPARSTPAVAIAPIHHSTIVKYCQFSATVEERSGSMFDIYTQFLTASPNSKPIVFISRRFDTLFSTLSYVKDKIKTYSYVTVMIKILSKYFASKGTVF